ncbi:MAG: hypothetical protein HN644_01475 [Rhodospirillales bacterium]|jgi:hypothetical protein|nr:hypothetical protein [Rhodospirillales bacterium]MBT4041069.1 hypothetical protein [Rhodospirillales bacterium]MBT4628392.1 hypothetical protein [Rhodospirillales bacterium]MBT5350957.1 hypothetical protein [Rhodospirillales bacterium]MBT5522128.1 hypothetical protein [Rhodospirillales bacterium]
MPIARTLILLIMTVLVLASAAQAQSGSSNQGLLNAVQYRPLPADAVIEVQALDNSEENISLVVELTRALSTLGYAVADKGMLVMTIETRDEIGAWTTSGDGKNIEFQAQQGSGGTGNSVDLRVNLFDSDSGGLLSNSQSNPTSIVTPSRYVVDITVDSREDGKRLWQGWISATLGQTNDPSTDQSLKLRMIPPLADAYGQTISKQVISLP